MKRVMKKLLVLFLTLAWLVSPVFGNTYIEMIGDDDNFGWYPDEPSGWIWDNNFKRQCSI